VAELQASVQIRAEPARVWEAVTDPAGQTSWMPLTRVRATRGDGSSPGDRIDARSGVGPFGFTDVMVVTGYQPPWRWQVRHLGRLVRGVGVFELSALGEGTRLIWSEFLVPPGGLPGQLATWLARPLAERVMRAALTRLASQLDR
jgi:uncharacterized protein YndB with AHSA1/START domain